MTQYLEWLFGFENVRSIDAISATFAAPWAGEQMWVLIGCCILAIAGVVLFYRRYENCNSPALRVTLTTVRAALLCFLLATLAAPIVHSAATVLQLPTVYLIVDDSESMSIADVQADEAELVTRTDQMRQLLSDRSQSLVQRIEQEAACHVELFKLGDDADTAIIRIDRLRIDDELLSNGKSTPLLRSLVTLPNPVPAAVIAFSDFADTSSEIIPDELHVAMASIGVPVHTVGLGATEARDVSISVQTESNAKLGEPTAVTIDVQHHGLEKMDANVTLELRALEYDSADGSEPARIIDQRTVTMDTASAQFETTFTPDTAGVVELIAKVSSFEGELLLENNLVTRQVGVIEDFLRVSYVEYEPNWEWRQIKEVFGRDKLVGRDGFRTYLASAAANVRSENALFSDALALPPSEFYANDVLFVGDVPDELLTSEFCAQMEEFVSRLGGGLVVIAGPRFGPAQLANTSLAKMLPVICGSESQLRDKNTFALQRTGEAALYPFMQLADTGAEDTSAWNNLGPLPWYQAVAGVHEDTQVLAEHPTDLCDDGQTRQPLIAIRPYGKGQVVYLGFNEMWRLRKRYGDRYYQRFWSQLIYRLGMSHAIGSDKRFVAEFDRHTYRTDEEAVFTVAALDEDYQPLGMSHLADGALVAQLTLPSASGDSTRKLSLRAERPGSFETVIPLAAVGRYSVRVTDPITGRIVERTCIVSDTSAEKQRITRDLELQQRIAAATGGTAYDISQVDQMIRDLALEPTLEQVQRQIALWNTPIWFLLVVGLMLSEWTLRKLAYLR